MDLIWIPYCIDCNREIENGTSVNGDWAEAAARVHREDHPGHRVIVGYEPRPSLLERTRMEG